MFEPFKEESDGVFLTPLFFVVSLYFSFSIGERLVLLCYHLAKMRMHGNISKPGT